MSFTQKTPNIKDISELNLYLKDLERRIFEAFQTGEFEQLNLKVQASAPDKPRQGNIIAVDGTNYDPGSGAGVYYYDTSYSKL